MSKMKLKNTVLLLTVIALAGNFGSLFFIRYPDLYNSFVSAAQNNWVGDGAIIGDQLLKALPANTQVIFPKHHDQENIAKRSFPYVIAYRISLYAHLIKIVFADYDVSLSQEKANEVVDACNSTGAVAHLSNDYVLSSRNQARHCKSILSAGLNTFIQILFVDGEDKYIIKKQGSVLDN